MLAQQGVNTSKTRKEIEEGNLCSCRIVWQSTEASRIAVVAEASKIHLVIDEYDSGIRAEQASTATALSCSMRTVLNTDGKERRYSSQVCGQEQQNQREDEKI